MATNWLTALSVDVSKLEDKHRPSVAQRYFYPDSMDLEDVPDKRKRVVLLPIFHVSWGNPKEPAVMVSVFGSTKELLGIRLDDESFSRRPERLLKNVEALLAIPDSEFVRYSAAERRDLVARFAAVDYGTNSYSWDTLEGHLFPSGTRESLHGFPTQQQIGGSK